MRISVSSDTIFYKKTIGRLRRIVLASVFLLFVPLECGATSTRLFDNISHTIAWGLVHRAEVIRMSPNWYWKSPVTIGQMELRPEYKAEIEYNGAYGAKIKELIEILKGASERDESVHVDLRNGVSLFDIYGKRLISIYADYINDLGVIVLHPPSYSTETCFSGVTAFHNPLCATKDFSFDVDFKQNSLLDWIEAYFQFDDSGTFRKQALAHSDPGRWLFWNERK